MNKMSTIRRIQERVYMKYVENNNAYLIADMPDHEKPRERLMEIGAENLTDTELVAIMVRTGGKGRSALTVARDILSHFGNNLERLSSATVNELCEIKGIGPAKAVELKAAFSLARRMAMRTQPNSGIFSPEDIAEYMREVFRGSKQEELYVVLLNKKNYIIGYKCVTKGLLDQSQIHPREVFRPAITEASAGIVLCHNHPSGDPRPSSQDLSSTALIQKSSIILGVELVDHIIVGHPSKLHPSGFFSFKRKGLLDIN